MQWEDVPRIIDDWADQTFDPAMKMKKTAADVITSSHVGYYYSPVVDRIGIFAPLVSKADAVCCKAAAVRAVGNDRVRSLFISYQELAEPSTAWVKVAYSPALRRAGELLNFFPGQLPGGIPNAPSPLAAMLTSGLVGAGLGWGAGKLIGRLMPEGYGDNLGRTGMMLGGLAGAAPGALWGVANHQNGRSLTDPWPLNEQAGDDPKPEQGTWMHGSNGNESVSPPEPHLPQFLREFTPRGRLFKRASDELPWRGPLGERYKRAVDAYVLKYANEFGPASWNDGAGTFGQMPDQRGPTPIDVNVNALGQTLWDTGAGPQLTAATMGAMYAAQQFPDRAARPGWVTGNQLGQLSMNAAGDYTKGLLAGAAINAAIGTPFRASTFGVGNAILGVLGLVVPRLFGGS